MLVSGSDLSFVAAAVQSWSLPHLSAKDKLSAGRTKVSLTSSLALLFLVALANAGHGHIVDGSLLGKSVLAWVLAEVLYFLYGKSRYQHVNSIVEVPLDVDRVRIIKERFLTLATVMPMEDFLSGWFRGAAPEDIKRGNVEQFVAYGFYCRRMDQLSPQMQQAVKDFVCEVEAAYGRKLEDGLNPDISFMAHMWEPLSMCAGAIAHAVLWSWGFQKHSGEDVSYWYRDGASHAVERRRVTPAAGSVHARGDSAASLALSAEDPGRRPLIFVHGVGFGIMPYLGFLWQLCNAHASHPIALLDIPHVALRPFTRAKNVDAIAAGVKRLLRRRRLGPACLVGHSFGSFCISRICQLHPEVVDSIALMDPVCCMTCYPKLLASFIYKGYTWHEAMGSLIGFAHTVRYIFSRDLIIAETFCRQFLWHSLMLWPEDMPRKAVVSVSANDDLVPAELVRAHLEATHARTTVMLHPTAAHGGIFLDTAHMGEFMGHVAKLVGGR